MPLPEPPPGWGCDGITEVFDKARKNEFATFANLKEEVNRLIGIDSLYKKIIELLNHSPEWFTGFFVLRAHSNYLAACRMCCSGQVPECYVLLRSCLENALYGLYLAKNPESREVWLRRHESEEHKRAVRNEFKIRNMFDLAVEMDKKSGEITEKLYERTIDYGAHPNERALMQTMQKKETDENIEFKIAYFDEDAKPLRLALKTTAQVGICSFYLFYPVYKERFDIMGITEKLDRVKEGL